MNIAEFIMHKLKALNSSHAGITPVTQLNQYDRMEKTIKTLNSNIEKCAVSINGEELSADELQKLKIKLPNLRPVVSYETCMGSTAENQGKVIKFTLEVS